MNFDGELHAEKNELLLLVQGKERCKVFLWFMRNYHYVYECLQAIKLLKLKVFYYEKYDFIIIMKRIACYIS